MRVSKMLVPLFILMTVEGSSNIVRRSGSLSGEGAHSSTRINDKEVLNFGRTFLNTTDRDLPMSPLRMILPEDSTVIEGHQESSNFEAMCGVRAPLRSMKRIQLDYEQRAVCPFSHVENRDDKRIPNVLNEVRCLCEHPAHIASSVHFSCEPVVYSIPVLRLHAKTGIHEQSTQDIVLACIPVLKRKKISNGDDLLIKQLKVSYS